MSDAPIRTLDEIRSDIDSIDAELVRLLSQRVTLAQEVGRVKGRDQRPFFTPERERAIYERLREINPGPLQTKQLIAVFREIISAARAAEKNLVCAYWGPAGTYTHLAAIQTFGSSTEFVPQTHILDVFRAVQNGEADYGVVPVENSQAGIVPETLDQFPKTNVKICAETYVSIQHVLVSTASDLGSIERVYAGFQPKSQCKHWLNAHLPNVDVIEVTPTTKAVERALMDPESAAICNSLAAEMYEIPILAEHIADEPDNRTRFVVLGYNEPARTGNDKTSVMFNVRNKPGELVKALRAFEDNGVNLTMIESRPAPRSSFDYLFYVDCDGHRQEDRMVRAIEDLKEHALETVLLGSYPRQDSRGG